MQASTMGGGPESVQMDGPEVLQRDIDRARILMPVLAAKIRSGEYSAPDADAYTYACYVLGEKPAELAARHVLPPVVDDREGKILRLASTKDLTFLVRVLKSRRVYGRTDLLVTPVSGQGEAWVSERKLAAPDGGNGQ
jgi:hypothetical protein